MIIVRITETTTGAITETATEPITKPVAWHNDPGLKAEVVRRMIEHREEDEFVKGHYQYTDPMAASGYRGCAIGCTLPHLRIGLAEPRWHREVEERYGIDRRVAIAIDNLFEDLPAELCADFAVGVIEAIPVGADLDAVAEAWRAFGRAGDHDVKGTAALLIKRLRDAPVPAPVPTPVPVLVPA